MTNPITPDVRAAVVRLRRLSQGDEYFDIYGVHPSGHGMQQRDEALVTNAMLALLPPGMPEPVERYADARLYEGRIASSAYSVPHALPDGNIRGLFIPLEKVEP